MEPREPQNRIMAPETTNPPNETLEKFVANLEHSLNITTDFGAGIQERGTEVDALNDKLQRALRRLLKNLLSPSSF